MCSLCRNYEELCFQFTDTVLYVWNWKVSLAHITLTVNKQAVGRVCLCCMMCLSVLCDVFFCAV